MGAPLREDLLFCLFSLLFGGAASLFAECLRTVFTALRLLSRRGQEPPPPLRVKIGFFLYDTLLFPSMASFYMIFLYFVNEGVFRVYSLLLCVLGFLLFAPLARLIACPLHSVLSWIIRLLCTPVRIFRRFFMRGAEKKHKRLDEKGEMVYNRKEYVSKESS